MNPLVLVISASFVVAQLTLSVRWWRAVPVVFADKGMQEARNLAFCAGVAVTAGSWVLITTAFRVIKHFA